jgi:hypothetical protein
LEDKKLNISELTRLLAPSGVEITSAHWGHVAFLVSEYIIKSVITSPQHLFTAELPKALQGHE